MMRHAIPGNLFDRALIHGILLLSRGGNRIPFDIPTELLQVGNQLEALTFTAAL